MRARLLIGIHTLVALNAVGGGIYGLTGAPGVPVAWLRGTPFESYLVPSLILLGVVGGSQALACFSLSTRSSRARRLSLAAGAVLLGWIGIQLALIGYVSWLQPAVALAALATLALASKLPARPRATV